MMMMRHPLSLIDDSRMSSYSLYSPPSSPPPLSLLETLPLEVLHYMVYTLALLSPPDILALSLTSKTMAHLVLSDPFARCVLFPAASASVSFCLDYYLFRAAAFLLNTSEHARTTAASMELRVVSRCLGTAARSTVACPSNNPHIPSTTTTLSLFGSLLAAFSSSSSKQDSVLCTLFEKASSALVPYVMDFVTSPKIRAVLHPDLAGKYDSPVSVMDKGSTALFWHLMESLRASSESTEQLIASLMELSVVEEEVDLLTMAVLRGDVGFLNELLVHLGEHVNDASDSFSGRTFFYPGISTPLAAAVVKNDVDIVRALLALPNIDVQKGTRPNSRNDGELDGEMRSPLGLAVSSGHHEIAALLLAHPGTNPNYCGYQYQELGHWRTQKDNRQTPLFIAMKKDDMQMVNLLLAHPDINVQCGIEVGMRVEPEEVMEPLLVAIDKGNMEMFSALLAHPSVDVNCTWVSPRDDDKGMTPLYLAVHLNYVEMVSALLSHPHIDPNAPREAYEFDEDLSDYDDTPRTPLAAAVESNNRTMIDLLLAHPKIDPNLGSDDQTPLFRAARLAARYGCIHSLQALLNHPHTDPNAVITLYDDVDQTALGIAIEENQLEAVTALVAHPKIDVNSVPYLAAAIQVRDHPPNVAIVKALLAHPSIDVNINSEEEIPLVQHAEEEGLDEIAALLRSHKSHNPQ